MFNLKSKAKAVGRKIGKKALKTVLSILFPRLTLAYKLYKSVFGDDN